jgi:hypothetical protein
MKVFKQGVYESQFKNIINCLSFSLTICFLCSQQEDEREILSDGVSAVAGLFSLSPSASFITSLCFEGNVMLFMY